MQQDTPTGMLQPHHQEATIRAQNAARVSHRAAVANLAANVAATGQGDLGRGPRRQVGGRFEALQAVPERVAAPTGHLNPSHLQALLAAFQFDAVTSRERLPTIITQLGPDGRPIEASQAPASPPSFFTLFQQEHGLGGPL